MKGKSFLVLASLLLLGSFSFALGDNWTAKADYPINISAPSCVNVTGGIYCVAGITDGDNYINNTYLYNISTDSWSQKADYPLSVKKHSCSPIGNNFYCTGGEDASYNIHNETYFYNISDDTWTQKADYPVIMGYSSCVESDGNIYCSGRYDGGGMYNETYMYNVSDDSWTQKSDYPMAINVHSCVGIGTSIYCAGGDDSSYNPCNNTYFYNISDDSWTQKADYPIVTSWHSCAVIGDDFYCVGGTFGLLNDTYLYDTSEDTWTSKADYPFILKDLSCSPAGDNFYCTGGDAGPYINNTYMYTPYSADVDATNPSVTINSPANQSWQNGTIAVNYTITDETATDTCHWRWQDGNTAWSSNSTITCGTNLTFNFDTSNCDDDSGANCEVEVWGNDTTDNSNSSVLYLKIDNTAPTQVSLDLPANETTSSDLTPYLNWTQTTEATSFDAYLVQVDNDLNFGSIDFAYTISGIANNFHQVVSAWTDQITYYWRVRANDSAANDGTWSDWFQYTTDATGPTFPWYNQTNSTGGEVDIKADTRRLVNLTWNITDISPINVSSCSIEVRANDTTIDSVAWHYSNDTLTSNLSSSGWWLHPCTVSYANADNTSIQVYAELDDSFEYRPTSMPIPREDIKDDTTDPIYKDHAIMLKNSNATAHANYMYLTKHFLNSLAATEADARLWYCNSSYVIAWGDYRTSQYCVIAATIAANETKYSGSNYYERYGSADENGTFGGIPVTSPSYFIIDSIAALNAVKGWEIVGTSGHSGHSYTSDDYGVTWTLKPDTEFDMAIQWFNAMYFETRINISDTIGNTVTDLQTDYFDTVNRAPEASFNYDCEIGGLLSVACNAVNVTEKGTLNVSADFLDPDGEHVNCTFILLNSDLSYNQTISEIETNASYGLYSFQYDTAVLIDGNYYFRVNATDGELVGTSTTHTIVSIDNTAPSVVINAPANQTWQKDTISVNYTITDGIGTDTCQWRWKDVDTGWSAYSALTCGSDLAFNFDTSNCDDDASLNCQIEVWANDTANTSNSSVLFLKIDNTAPTQVTLDLPPNQTISSDLTPYLNWTQTTEATSFETYWVQVDDSAAFDSLNYNYSITGITNNSYQVLSDWADQTSYYWRVRANDTIGNEGDWSDAFLYTTDAEAPSVVINAPANQTWQKDTISMNYTITDGIGTDTCQWRWKDADTGWSAYSALTCGSDLAFNFDTTNCDDDSGANCEVEVWANDTANTSNSSVLFLKIDNTAPTKVVLELPANQTISSDLTPYLNWTQTTEATSFETYWVQVDDSAAFDSLNYNYSIIGTNNSYQVLSDWTDQTSYYWRVRANDTIGNEGTWSDPFTYTTDAENPLVTINTPENITYNTTTLPLSLVLNTTISDLTGDTCQYSLDDFGTNTTYDCVNVTISASAGSNTLLITVNDSAGNVNNTESVSFIVNAFPEIHNLTYTSIINPTESGTTAVTILLNATDGNGNADISTAQLDVIGLTNSSINYTNSTCTNTTMNATTLQFTCIIQMNYYDKAQEYLINTTVTDIGNLAATNDTENFTYTLLTAHSISTDSIVYTATALGTIDNPANGNESVNVTNTGNCEALNMSLSATDMVNVSSAYSIGVGNISAQTSGLSELIFNTSLQDYTKSGSISLIDFQAIKFFLDIPAVLDLAVTYVGNYTISSTCN